VRHQFLLALGGVGRSHMETGSGKHRLEATRALAWSSAHPATTQLSSITTIAKRRILLLYTERVAVLPLAGVPPVAHNPIAKSSELSKALVEQIARAASALFQSSSPLARLARLRASFA